MVTHCGWNSVLEGVTAGVPMVTWPLFADQFYNEKLVTQVLKIVVSVGVEEMRIMGVSAKREAIEKALKEIMVGDGAEEMKKRDKSLGLMARRAVEDGGSSCSDLNALIKWILIQRKKLKNNLLNKPLEMRLSLMKLFSVLREQ
ncbi:hypothetical protein LWI28_015333 [Acer negundo]|uniref:Glucosyltransferase n=1 Tax=Acer negundo TaxID=4023 RepID=A0AAD5NT81_ACENE|nr:hypothetical protein LWI28_015333 [Acer negundo]